jgi:hypothetical protein
MACDLVGVEWLKTFFFKKKQVRTDIVTQHPKLSGTSRSRSLLY